MTTEAQLAALTTATTDLHIEVVTLKNHVSDETDLFTATTTWVNSHQNVENTTDLNKVISTATQTALDGKQDVLVDGDTISTVNGVSLLSGTPLVIERSATSLSEVSYDSRGSIKVLTPTLNDSIIIEGLGLFMWFPTQEEPEDDETCFNTSTGQWLLETPAWDLINAWNSVEQVILDDFIEDAATTYVLV
jgi:hypothetical protein